MAVRGLFYATRVFSVQILLKFLSSSCPFLRHVAMVPGARGQLLSA